MDFVHCLSLSLKDLILGTENSEQVPESSVVKEGEGDAWWLLSDSFQTVLDVLGCS